MADTPGWDAIQAACVQVYGDQEPQHWGTVIGWRLGGPDPLDGISAYDAGDHWHLVSFGLSELYEKASDLPDESGWGFELTMRLERTDDSVPPWALSFLQNLARYVFRTGNPFGPGHHMDLNGPIAQGVDTPIRAILFDEDPKLGTIRTPNGTLRFLQIVGVTLDERAAAMRWDGLSFARLLRQVDPDRVVRLGRSSVLDQAAVRAAVDDGVARDGSSCGALFVSDLAWSEDGARVTLGALAVRGLLPLIPGRLGFDRTLSLFAGDGRRLVLEAGARSGHAVDGDTLTLTLAPQEVASFPLAARRGAYALAGAEVTVEPTPILDDDDRVIEVVG